MKIIDHICIKNVIFHGVPSCEIGSLNQDPLHIQRYSPYLPGRIYEYLKIDDLKTRKERIRWLLSLIITYEMQEINERFYESTNDTDPENKIDTLHPFRG